MTTEQKFNCIFCKDVFDNKEELQVHFRKHADPKFKGKNRFEICSQESNENVKEKAEMVSCDVCSQMFPTLSKAITHKHKVHPDHDVKYFCPWCGKLFTMKHPYNIHIQTSHIKQEQIEDKIFHCDCCDVDFFLPSAMMYHNKFFHWQDTDIPEVRSSKKLKLYNQEVIHLYYCAFCGEEYENKVNLFKHITDDHSDENQCPEEVLRCSLCDAIFYHLDAYEIHLSFHTPDDLYSGNNELTIADLMDFSLESVPPIIEKVENREDLDGEAQSQDTDLESSVNAVGIDKFLELAMDQTEDSNPGKVKKKKHKKSKKSAITLDEFLSMNQDVFGEGLDFHGVEEVPTRVVAKQFKSSKKSTNAVAAAELEKLKQKGIVVMKVAPSKPTKNAQKKNVSKTSTTNRELKTSSEVLTKLMNQSNNQIKIVKKPISNTPKIETAHGMNTTADDSITSDQSVTDNDNQTTNQSEEHTEEQNKIETNNSDVKLDSQSVIENIDKNMASPKAESPASTLASADLAPPESGSYNANPLHDEDNIEKETGIENYTEETSTFAAPTSPKVNENKDNVESSITIHNKVMMGHEADQEETDKEIIDKDNSANNSIVKNTDEDVDNVEATVSDNNSSQPNINPVVNSLSTLKHLSHLTVKPVNQNKNTISSEVTTEDITENKNDQNPQIKKDKELPLRLNIATDNDNDINPIQQKPTVDNDPTLGALKNLCRNITIKPVSTSSKRHVEDSDCDDDNQSDKDVQKPISNLVNKDVGANKNLTIKKIKIEKNEPTNKIINAVTNAIKNTKLINKPTSSPELKPSKNSTNITQNSPIKNNTILKHLPNITTKPVITKKIIQSPEIQQINASVKPVETQQKQAEIIEISDIDDSEDESDNKEAVQKQNTPNTIDPLRNLSKHITVKPLSQPVPQPLLKKIKIEKVEEQNEEDHDQMFNSDDDNMPSNIKVCNQKLSGRNMAFKNALKNLGKNITVKSRTSSPSQSVKSQDNNSQDFNAGIDDDGNNSDAETGKVKITEIENENSNHDDLDEYDNCDEAQDTQPIVESPHESCSDDDEEAEKDFETEIKASTVQKVNHEITTNKNTICLNNLKNISKSITVKSLNSSFSEKQEHTKPMQSQENVEVMKSQGKPIPVKTAQQIVTESQQENSPKGKNINSKKLGKIVDHTSNESLNQQVSVNKEVTVKTFHTKTVIQEITTTVTKTIKTVNQTVNKQEVRSSNQMNIPVLPQRVQGMKPSTSKNLQGVVIRHAAPASIKKNNGAVQVRPVGTVVRPSKQIVPLRPGLNTTRPSVPRMPNVKNNLPKSSPSPNKPVIGKPLKFSPSVLTSTSVKRPSSEEVSGPFSCFKKPKESLIPVSDVPTFSGGGESVVQVNAASHTNTSNYTSASKIVKGNSVVTMTQIKSEVSSMQQLSRLSNTVGIKVKSAQVKQTQVQDKSECSAMKRTTLEAIEKLQKQGLLIKKPRVEVNEANDSEHVDDNVGNSSADEHDE